MTCIQFRDVLDVYIDRELATDAMAAATAHRGVCASCERLAVRALETKAAVRRLVMATNLPAGLETRVRATAASRRRWQALAAVLVVGLSSGFAMHRQVASGAANAMDRMAVGLEDSRTVVLTGTVLCRDCELERRYGIKARCNAIGHHGAIATDDGRIWNLVEQQIAADLIHDDALHGRRVEVHGRVFRGARTLVIDSYRFTS